MTATVVDFSPKYYTNQSDRVAVHLKKDDSIQFGHFATARDAHGYGNMWYIPGGFATFYMLEEKVPDSALATLYDCLATGQPIEFKDRESAAREVWQLLHQLPIGEPVLTSKKTTATKKTSTILSGGAKSLPLAQQQENEMKNAAAASATATKTAPTAAPAKKAAAKTSARKTPAKKAAKKAAPAGAGRISMFAGKTLRVGKIEKDKATGKLVNPRRPGTAGNEQLGWIISAGDNGISYEKWIEKGGLPINLRHDVAQGWVKFS